MTMTATTEPLAISPAALMNALTCITKANAALTALAGSEDDDTDDKLKASIGEALGKAERLLMGKDEPPPTEPLLRAYLNLHDRLSDMIEDGRLREADIPDDYAWLVESLANLATLSDAAGMPAPNTQDA